MSKFLPYPQALKLLAQLINATPADMAGWVFMGRDNHGLDAYTSANEFTEPPRFFFSQFLGAHDYMGLLITCWFKEEDLHAFAPPDAESRFLTGGDLIKRWQHAVPGATAVSLIRTKIGESRLLDIHPLTGQTQASCPDDNTLPAIEEALFVVAHVLAIEQEDLDYSPLAELTAVAFSGIPNPPARKDELFDVIRKAVYELANQLGRAPTESETWTKLKVSPPIGFGITASPHDGESAVWIDEKPLTRSAFKERWKRYFQRQ